MAEKQDAFAETRAIAPGDGAKTTPTAGDLLGGTVLAGRYELVALLGQGGMGSVYKARDLTLDELVALKMLRADLADNPELRERFIREVKLARRVTHENVARTFDIGQHDDTHFLTMQLIDGTSLGRYMSQTGALRAGCAARLGLQVARGLAAAHAAGVIHRDLKPDNILLDKSERAFISDFGIASARLGDHPTSERAIGTPAYMAPEQVRGSTLDHRADIYALGAILFELVTGLLPFSGDNPFALALARLDAPAPDPRRLAEMPDPLAELVMDCMHPDVASRPQSAAEVAERLHPFVGERPTPLPPSPSTGSARVVTALTPPAVRSIAILPIDARGDDDVVYLAEGLTEDVIDQLSTMPGLRVRPLSFVRANDVTNRGPQQLGDELGVEVVASGSISRRGDHFRIRIRLTSTRDGFQLWADRFSAGPGDIYSVSDEIAEAIGVALEVRPSARRDAPADPQAIDLYLRGRHALRAGYYTDVTEAVRLLEEAVVRGGNDPQILGAAALANIRAAFLSYTTVEHDAAMARADNLAVRAISAAPDRPEGRVAHAWVRFHELATGVAAQTLRQVLTRLPFHIESHDLLGRALIEMGPLEEGIHHLETAVGLDPSLANPRLDLARAYALVGDWDRAASVTEPIGSVARADDGVQISLLRLSVWKDLTLDEDKARRTLMIRKNLTGAGRLVDFVLHLHRHGFDDVGRQRFDAVVNEQYATARRDILIKQVTCELACVGGYPHLARAPLARALALGLADVQWADRCPAIAPIRGEPWFVQVRDQVAQRAAAARDIAGYQHGG